MTSALICSLSVLGCLFLVASENGNAATMKYDASLTDPSLDKVWEEFKTKHEKKYEQGEELSRRLIWEANIRHIREHNLKFDLGRHSYSLGVNAMSDLTQEEFKKLYLPGLGEMRNRKGNTSSSTFLPLLNVPKVPTTVDWRKEGYVTPIKDQGQCGSCWTFSTTGTLEGQYFRKTKKLVSFSEQQLVDCSGDFGTEGCSGGWPEDAMSYIQKSGIEAEEDYPYRAKDGMCRYTASRVVTKDGGSAAIPVGDEEALRQAVANIGPISVCIDANHESFMQYKDGVYDEPACTIVLDHAVLIVGYGTTANGKDYWLVKNSWGTTWGQEGYVQMSRNKQNQCGIASHARYPLL